MAKKVTAFVMLVLLGVVVWVGLLKQDGLPEEQNMDGMMVIEVLPPYQRWRFRSGPHSWAEGDWKPDVVRRTEGNYWQPVLSSKDVRLLLREVSAKRGVELPVAQPAQVAVLMGV